MARAGSMNTPGPFNFRGCGLTAECLLAREMVRVRFPAAAPTFFPTGCASARGRVPKTPLTPGGTEAACHFRGAVAEKWSACLASSEKRERYPPDSTNFDCGELD